MRNRQWTKVAPLRNAFFEHTKGVWFCDVSHETLIICILGRFASWISWYYCFDTHHSTSTPCSTFIRKKLKCHDMISVSHNHHSTNGLIGGWVFGLMWSSTCRNGGFRWLDAFLAWYTVSQSPGDCRGPKTVGGIRWSHGGPEELKGFWGGWKADYSRRFFGWGVDSDRWVSHL